MSVPAADGLELDPHTGRLFLAAQAAGMSPAVVVVNEGQTSFAAGPWVRLNLDGSTYFYRAGAVRLGTPNGLPGAHINGTAARITKSKSATRAVLAAAGLPIAPGRTFDRTDRRAGLAFAAGLSPAACLKRDDGTQGNLVFPNCRNADETGAAWDAIATRSPSVLVEQNVAGEVLRYFYVEPDIVGIRNNRPAAVVGDGHSSVRELVAATNEARVGAVGLHPILIDEVDETVLDSVPAPGATVQLAHVPSVWNGGEHISLGFDEVDATITDIARRAFRSVPGLRIGAIDMIVPDLDRGGTAEGCCILEINSSPGIAPFHEPSRGFPQDVAGAILRLLRNDAVARRVAAPAEPAVTWTIATPPALDADALALQAAATARGLTSTAVRDGEGPLALELELGGLRYHYRGRSLRAARVGTSDEPVHVNGDALKTTRSDVRTRRVLKDAGFPVPDTRVFKPEQMKEAVRFAMRLSGHVLVRPDAVRTDADTTAQTRRALAAEFQRAAASGRRVLVEAVPEGDELRLFCIEGGVVAVVAMRRPVLVADGTSSLLALASRATDVVIGTELVGTLARQGDDLQDVPPKGTVVRTRELPVLEGVEAAGLTAIHPSFLDVARRAAQAIDGFVLGTVILRAADIAAPAVDGNCTVLAVKSSPGIAMFAGPDGNPVANAIVEWMMRAGEAT